MFFQLKLSFLLVHTGYWEPTKPVIFVFVFFNENLLFHYNVQYCTNQVCKSHLTLFFTLIDIGIIYIYIYIYIYIRDESGPGKKY